MGVENSVQSIIENDFVFDTGRINLLISACKRFDEMVKNGITAPRQSNLMPLDERYEKRIHFNVENQALQI